MRRVVVSDDHDGTRSFDNGRTRCGMETHNVLADGPAGQLADNRASRRLQKQRHGTDQHKQDADRKRPALSRSAQKGADKHQRLEQPLWDASECGAVKLLDGHLDAVLGHHVGNGLRGEILLLGVGGSNRNPVVKIAEKFLGLGHGRIPLFARLALHTRARTYRDKYTPRRKQLALKDALWGPLSYRVKQSETLGRRESP